MRLHVVTGGGAPIFWLESTYDERETSKGAGFWWHGQRDCRPTCGACAAGLGKVWWTPRLDVATRLGADADADARRALGLADPPPEPPPPHIPDVNLRLAIFEALRTLGLAPKARRGRRRGSDDDDGFYDSSVVERLLGDPPPRDHLAQVIVLDWDAVSPTVINEICPDWDGETEEFDLEDLTGIAACPNLKEVRIDSFVGGDLSPLVALRQLKRLELGRSTKVKDLAPLLEIAGLERVRISTEAGKPLEAGPNAVVVAALLARGVELELNDKQLAPTNPRPPAPAPTLSGEVSPARLRALDAQGDKLRAHRDYREAAAVFREALLVREALAARGELSPGAGFDGITTGEDMSRETNVAAGLFRIGEALRDAELVADSIPVRTELAALLVAADRTERATQTVLAVLAEDLLKAKQWSEALRIARLAASAVARSRTPVLAWLEAAGNAIAKAAARAKVPEAQREGFAWVVLADHITHHGDHTEDSKAARDALYVRPAMGEPDVMPPSPIAGAFLRGCGIAAPRAELRAELRAWAASLDEPRLTAGAYQHGFLTLFAAELAALDPLVQDRATGGGPAGVIGRNAYGVLLVTTRHYNWYGGSVVIAFGPDYPSATEPAVDLTEAIGLRLPARSLGMFTDTGPYAAWVARHGPLPADHVLALQRPGAFTADNLVAMPITTYYARWPATTAPPPPPKKQRR